MKRITTVALALFLFLTSAPQAQGQQPNVPAVDRRLTDVRDHNSLYKFRPYTSKEEWLGRSDHLRQQILVGAGLWPMPVKGRLNARIFGRVEHPDYSVEKVYFESHPGFLVTGNLYRPRGKTGPFPAIVSPHGHWTYGRLENTETSSVPGRAINLARQGYVVFSYDMIGYNDSQQLNHRFGGRREELWGISLSGLQLWNSIRSVDFLCSLDDVDRERIGATGASGGGTQTFLLMAIDERVKVGAPVNMVSAHMQGGCLCENTPGLRIDTSNVELAALAAPRPLLLVSATGDWTVNTMNVEYPAIQSIYRLFNADDRVRAVQINSGHNYNKESREAVYSWFGQWFLNAKEPAVFKERGFRPEPAPALLVFYDHKHPYKEIDAIRLSDYLISSSEKQLGALTPTDKEEQIRFEREMRPALAHALGVDLPDASESMTWGNEKARVRGITVERFYLGRKDQGDRIPAILWRSRNGRNDRSVTLVVHQEGKSALSGRETGRPFEIVSSLLEQGQDVLAVDCFQVSEGRGESKTDSAFFTTYNRTVLANRVQDILTAVAFLKNRPGVARVNLVGIGQGGLWSLLARGLARGQIDNAVVDLAQFNERNDEDYLQNLFAPNIRRVGGLRTAILLAAPSRMIVHNTGDRFEMRWLAEFYEKVSAASAIEIHRGRLSDSDVVKWLTR
jgi:cephalosporin-C deacetylase-like acetyl esterase